MLRNAAIVLTLLVAAMGAQAQNHVEDLPKVPRELHFKNKTKATAKNTGARSKARMAELCLSDLSDQLTLLPNDVEPTAYLFSANWNVYYCSDIIDPVGEPDFIGAFGVTCSNEINLDYAAPCTMILSVDTAWHKTTAVSTLTGSFWMDPKAYVEQDPQVITMYYPVVTGTTGAWGKPDAFHNLMLTPVTEENTYKLTMQYKKRGWNPTPN